MDNRDLLLETSLKLFSQRGYDSIGVLEIAQTSGLTKPTLYHYFGNKHGLLEALLGEHHQPLLEAIEAAAVYHGNLTDTLTRVMNAYLGFASQSPEFYRFWLTLLFAPPEHEASAPARRLYQKQQALLEGVFKNAAKDHGNMRGRHERYAYAFIGSLNNLAALALGGNHKITASMRRDFLHQFSHGIYS